MRRAATGSLLFVSLLPVLGSRDAVAADDEVRTFAVKVDDKPAGEYKMTIGQRDSGTITMAAQAEISFQHHVVLTYTYSYRGSEVWKDGRLMRLDSTGNDDGKRFALTAVANKDRLRVRVNGQDREARSDLWPTTYWRLANAKYRNKAISLLDADTGKEIDASLNYIDKSDVNIAGRLQRCAHYRVSGGVQVELWYDAADRLVRQESLEEGHRTVLELTSVRRQSRPLESAKRN